MKLMNLLKRIYWVLSEQFGLDPLKTFNSLRGLPRYVRDLLYFRMKYRGRLELTPCLFDWYEEGGATKNEYFWQDLLVAQDIFKRSPKTHADIGSRIDGFVAHISCFRDLDVFDIRDMQSVIPGVRFRQLDAMCEKSVSAYLRKNMLRYDSLSCLHALEHFGLGRYGDTVNPLGYRRGIENLSKFLEHGGRLYLSVPIGRERVEFNANWVFNPGTILEAASAAGLNLYELTVLDQQGGHEKVIAPTREKLDALAKEHYRLGIFHFIKQLAQ